MFQPFLRFWFVPDWLVEKLTPIAMFQPFLRFWAEVILRPNGEIIDISFNPS